MPIGMRRGWQVTGIVMLLICVVAGWEATNLALFDRLGPGAGFFPFYLALIGAVLSVLIVVQVSRAPATEAGSESLFPSGVTAWRGVAILALTGLATAALDWLGFRLTIALFSAALLFALGERRWWALALFALVAGFGLFYVFNNWLDVILPVGDIGI